MHILERMYRSNFGRRMSFVARQVAWVHKPFMVYGYYDYPSRSFRKYTRLSSTVTIMNKKDLSMGDYVWVWHHTILNASQGIIIGEGCQIGAWVSSFTHGSQDSIRLLGRKYVHIPNIKRKGYSRGKVEICAYTFIGAGSVILPGVKIGTGCLIGAGTVVTKDISDHSRVVGNPGEQKGSTIDRDTKLIENQDFSETYYDQDAFAIMRKRPASATIKREDL